MKASLALDDVHAASRPGTRLRVVLNPSGGIYKVLRLLAVVLLARHALVPGHLVLEAHLKVARRADDVRVVGFLVKLAVVASLAEAPAEVWVGREIVEKLVAVVSVERGKQGGGRESQVSS